MVYLEQIFEVVESMIGRYGVTLTEIPERFKSKVLHKFDAEDSIVAEVEQFFKLLLSETIRPVRTKAGSNISRLEYNKVVARAVEFDELDEQSAQKIVGLWAKAFHVKVREDLPPMIDKASEISVDDFDVSVPDCDFTIKTNDDVERIINQFDTIDSVDEPQVADYEPHFEEFDTDMSVKTSQEEADEAQTPGDSFASESRQRVHKKKSRTESVHSGNFDVATIDDAFKALRLNQFTLAGQIMTKLARGGDVRAQFHLGEFYHKGMIGPGASKEKAKFWFEKAARKGSIPARTALQEMEAKDSPGGCCGCLAIMGFVVSFLFILSIAL